MLRFSVRNFQSLAAAEGVLEGLTILTGPTNLGKSALVRALRAVTYNDMHASFVREGRGCVCEVTLSGIEGPIREITLRRSSKLNEFLVTGADGESRKYPKTGKTVPAEIEAAGFQALRTERGDEHNLNFQGQLEPLFVTADSDVVLTSLLNTLFDIAPYERALRDMSTDAQRLSSRYDGLGVEIQAAEQVREDLTSEVSSRESRIAKLQALLSRAADAEVRVAELESGVARAQTLSRVKNEAEAARLSVNSLLDLTARVGAAATAVKAFTSLSRIRSRLTEIETRHSEARKASGFLRNLDGVLELYLRGLREVSRIRVSQDGLVSHRTKRVDPVLVSDVVALESRLLDAYRSAQRAARVRELVERRLQIVPVSVEGLPALRSYGDRLLRLQRGVTFLDVLSRRSRALAAETGAREGAESLIRVEASVPGRLAAVEAAIRARSPLCPACGQSVPEDTVHRHAEVAA